MKTMANRAVGAVALCLAACSPYGGGSFTCTDDDSCGAGGVCEADGFCAFSDTTCASGLKYGGLSGPSSNQCVPAAGGDGGVADAAPDTPPNEFCYGTGVVVACFAAPPTGTQAIATPIDTDTFSCADVIGTSPGCVIAADSITISGPVNVTGGQPLVLVAVTTIEISGTLDASSHRGGQTGAAANAATCDPGTAPSGAHDGGAGGSFGGTGGGGGGGTGIPGATSSAATLHGGCPGQDGGGANKGAHGDGGGAVYLIADGSIAITGTIDASGAGATGGQAAQSGGGGAGAGGMIGLDSPTVTGGMIYANGGGGGEGGTAAGNAGNVGQDPTSPMMPAAGGTGSTSGGDGGAGAAGGALVGMPGMLGTGGGANGGGGGGAGVVKLYRAQMISGGMVSPPPS
jgi:hypothetical protein